MNDILVNILDIGGVVIRDNDIYRVTDNRTLNNLVLSNTELYEGQETSGHSHDDLEEVYLITHGQGEVQIGENTAKVSKGSIVLIPAGHYHKVWNKGLGTIRFTCVFESYERNK